MRQLKIKKQITPRGQASLDKYLHEISRYELLTAEEEVKISRMIKSGDKDAFKKLINSNLRFVVSVAKQYQNKGLSLPDLINEGNLGLIKAATRFDHSRGFKFISYAVWWIRQTILQALSEQVRTVKLPLNKLAEREKIRKSSSKLEQRFEREPSADELSEEIDLSFDKISEHLAYNGETISYDNDFSDLNDHYSGTLLDVLDDPQSPKADQGMIDESLQKEIQEALSSLTQIEKDIIRLYFGIGLNHGKSLEEIGEMHNRTRERIRQIKEKAISKLRESPKARILKSYLD